MEEHFEEIKFAASLFFDNNKDSLDGKNIVNVCNYIGDFYNSIFSEFGFCIEEDGKDKNKSYKFTAKNVEKFFSINLNKLSSIYFEKFKEKRDYQDTELSVRIYIPEDNAYPLKVNITVDPILVKSFNYNELIMFIKKIKEFDFLLEYGVAFVIETRKMPNFFMLGIETPDLSPEEREVANSLALNVREYKNKIWDIFWINIIKKELITQDIYYKIIDIVGNKNVIETDDIYIFFLPLDYSEYLSIQKLDQYRLKLRNLFEGNNLIMYKKV